MRTAFIAATLALVVAAPAQAKEQYQLRNAADLARVCATPASASDAAVAAAFCHGVLAGAYGYFMHSTPAADRFVCLPNPSPTRAKAAEGFVAWLKANPQNNNDGAVDALFRYAASAFPCKR